MPLKPSLAQEINDVQRSIMAMRSQRKFLEQVRTHNGQVVAVLRQADASLEQWNARIARVRATLHQDRPRSSHSSTHSSEHESPVVEPPAPEAPKVQSPAPERAPAPEQPPSHAQPKPATPPRQLPKKPKTTLRTVRFDPPGYTGRV